MSVDPLTFAYRESQRREDIQAALGGAVWWRGAYIYWTPEGHEIVIRVQDPGHHESFDPEAWAERTAAEWRRRGVIL